MLSIGCQEEEIFVICDGDQYCFSSWYTRLTHRCYYTSPRQGYTSLYFSKYGLFNLLFSSVMGLYATQKNSISAFQPYSFQHRRRYRTRLFPVLGFYSRQNEYIKLQICGNCLHVENLSSSTLFIITFVWNSNWW